MGDARPRACPHISEPPPSYLWKGIITQSSSSPCPQADKKGGVKIQHIYDETNLPHIMRFMVIWKPVGQFWLFSSLRKKIVMCKILRSLKFESSETVSEYYERWKCKVSTSWDCKNLQSLTNFFFIATAFKRPLKTCHGCGSVST